MPIGCFQELLNLYFFHPHKCIACPAAFCAAARDECGISKTTVKGCSAMLQNVCHMSLSDYGLLKVGHTKCHVQYKLRMFEKDLESAMPSSIPLLLYSCAGCATEHWLYVKTSN